MSNPIILNFRVPVNLRDVFVIERVLPSDRDRIRLPVRRAIDHAGPASRSCRLYCRLAGSDESR